MGTEGIQNAYSTGRGQIIVRAKARIEPMRRSNRMQIIVSELPYQVNKAALVEKVASLVKDRKIEGISDLRDESDREGMRVVFELRAGVQPRVVLNNLYKFTRHCRAPSPPICSPSWTRCPASSRSARRSASSSNFARKSSAAEPNSTSPRPRQRAHILAGLRIAISHLDEVINLIRDSESAQAARQQLIARFGLDDDQAQAILDMQPPTPGRPRARAARKRVPGNPRIHPQDGRTSRRRKESPGRNQERTARPQEEARRRAPEPR